MTNSKEGKKKRLGKIVEMKYHAQAIWLRDAAQACLTFVVDNCFTDDKFTLMFDVFPQEHNIGKVDDAFLNSCKV